jgi:hypothetical protein
MSAEQAGGKRRRVSDSVGGADFGLLVPASAVHSARPAPLVGFEQATEVIPKPDGNLEHGGDLSPARECRPAAAVYRLRILIVVPADRSELEDGLLESVILGLGQGGEVMKMRAHQQ